MACFGFLLVLWAATSFVGYELLSVRGSEDDGGLTPSELFLSGSWCDLSDNVAYVLAEEIHIRGVDFHPSGVLAVVVAGLLLGHKSPAIQ